MPSPGTVCSLLLLGMLWLDLAMAGSSFLSPEHQRVQQRKESKKPPAKLQPRALAGWLRPEDGGQAEGAEDELEIRFNDPFDVGIKLSGVQYQQHSQALGKFLQDILWEEAKGESCLDWVCSVSLQPHVGVHSVGDEFSPTSASPKELLISLSQRSAGEWLASICEWLRREFIIVFVFEECSKN
ncbi:appetite-regulating hormone isoform X1 [Pan troglodytes]|nr:appetite-regulating hormone isoform X2 [Pan troglodytes]